MQTSRSKNQHAASRGERLRPTACDGELAIIAAAKLNPDAFEPLYRQYAGLVYHYALGRLRRPR